MAIPSIKNIVKDNTVRFVKFRQGFFYYRISVIDTDTDLRDADAGYDFYTFPVPLSDIGDATLEASDKAIIFMRYIRKAIEDGTFVRA